jgi:hypothetical protein
VSDPLDSAVLSEVAQRILAELEEWSQENFPTLLNTCCGTVGEPGECIQLRDALAGLYASGLVCFTIPDEERVTFPVLDDAASIELLGTFEHYLQYDNDRQIWTGRARPWPQVIATPEAQARGRQLMDVRGYRWWRQSDS